MYMCAHILCMKIYSYVYECIVVVDVLRHNKYYYISGNISTFIHTYMYVYLIHIYFDICKYLTIPTMIIHSYT